MFFDCRATLQQSLTGQDLKRPLDHLDQSAHCGSFCNTSTRTLVSTGSINRRRAAVSPAAFAENSTKELPKAAAPWSDRLLIAGIANILME